MRAAARGESLKELVIRAVAHELRIPAPTGPGRRISLPLIGHEARPGINVTNADIDAALEAEDADRYAGQ